MNSSDPAGTKYRVVCVCGYGFPLGNAFGRADVLEVRSSLKHSISIDRHFELRHKLLRLLVFARLP